MCDYFSPMRLFIGGIIFGSVVNLCIGFDDEVRAYSYLHIWNGLVINKYKYFSNSSVYSYLLAINGMAQGVGGPAASKLVQITYPQCYTGSVWAAIIFV